MLFDTHAHLDDGQFDDAEAVIGRAVAASVTRMIAIGTTAESSRDCVSLANEFPEVFAAVGVQPNYTHEATQSDWDQVEELATEPRVVAIGETGLDHYWDYADLEIQRDYFRRHIRLSQRVDKPFVIHMRDPSAKDGEPPSRSCSEDIFAELMNASLDSCHLRGVMHSYTGDIEMADKFLDLGLYISFAGMVTFKKSKALRQVAKHVPDDRILVETDAPYLSPHPFRGTRPNEPAMVVHTARCLAEVRGVGYESFARQCALNAEQLFLSNVG